MAYCTISDVEALNAQRTQYSTTTKPNITQVNSMIELIYAEICTTILATGNAIPAQNDYLKMVNAMGAAGMAEGASSMTGSNEAVEPRNWRWAKYKSMLDMIITNPDMINAAGGAVISNGGSRSDGTEGYINTDSETHVEKGVMW